MDEVLHSVDVVRPELARRYVAHALRSHLGIVISVARLLDADNSERRVARLKLMAALRGSADLLVRLLDDWAGSGTAGPHAGFKFEFAELELSSWLNSWRCNYLVSAVDPSSFDDAKLRLKLLDPLARIVVDPDRLSQCLLNLVSNAFKYGNGAQGVVIEVDRRGNEIFISVVDSGPGLAAEQVSQLFQPFMRLRQNPCVPGQGLGLSLTRLLASAMQGRVEAHSVLGSGSRFTLVFPAAEQTEIHSGSDAGTRHSICP